MPIGATSRKETKDLGKAVCSLAPISKGKSVLGDWWCDDRQVQRARSRSATRKSEAKVAGIIVALDRKEKVKAEQSTIQELAKPQCTGTCLGHDGWHYQYVIKMVPGRNLPKCKNYREQYGVQ